MTEHAPLVTILCTQCSRHAQVRRGEPLPEGWAEHVGQLSCSETCRELFQSMGLIPESTLLTSWAPLALSHRQHTCWKPRTH